MIASHPLVSPILHPGTANAGEVGAAKTVNNIDSTKVRERECVLFSKIVPTAIVG